MELSKWRCNWSFSKVLRLDRGMFRILSNIFDEVFCKNSYWTKAVNFFRKKIPSYIYGRILNTSLLGGGWSFFLQNYKNILLSHSMPLVSCYTPLSLPENIRKPFGSHVFRGYRMRPIAWNGLSASLTLGSCYLLFSHLEDFNFQCLAKRILIIRFSFHLALERFLFHCLHGWVSWVFFL